MAGAAVHGSFALFCSQLPVAFHSILVAITVQPAQWQVFWGEGGFAVESAAARVCREAGARVSLNVRVSMNVRVQDMDPRPSRCHGSTTARDRGGRAPFISWSATRDRHHGCVSPQAQWDSTPHVAQMRTGLLWKWPEGAKRQPMSEVSGRWSEECRKFPSQLAKGEGPRLPSTQGSRQASVALQVVAVQLERRGGIGADGDTPSTTEVLADARYLGVHERVWDFLTLCDG